MWSQVNTEKAAHRGHVRAARQLELREGPVRALETFGKKSRRRHERTQTARASAYRLRHRVVENGSPSGGKAPPGLARGRARCHLEKRRQLSGTFIFDVIPRLQTDLGRRYRELRGGELSTSKVVASYSCSVLSVVSIEAGDIKQRSRISEQATAALKFETAPSVEFRYPFSIAGGECLGSTRFTPEGFGRSHHQLDADYERIMPLLRYKRVGDRLYFDPTDSENH